MKRRCHNRPVPLLPRGRTFAAAGPSLPLQGPWPDWPTFWRDTSAALQQRGYTRSTLFYYRQILRAFSRHTAKPPAAITREDVLAYLHRLARSRPSAHWTAMNISVLRTLFDKLTGQGLLHRIASPRLPRRIPDTLSTSETQALLNAAESLRDELLLHLLIGHGLKPADLRSLRWSDLEKYAMRDTGCTIRDSRHATLDTGFATRESLTEAQRHGEPETTRTSHQPSSFAAEATEDKSTINHLFTLAHRLGITDNLIFTGPNPNTPITARSLERVLRALATAAGLDRPVTAMTLRHTFAVACLRSGMSLPELQQRLGHKTLEATARYLRCTLPPHAASPLDALASHRPPPAEAVLDVLEESIASPNLKSPITNQQFFRLLKTRLRSGFLRLASILLGA